MPDQFERLPLWLRNGSRQVSKAGPLILLLLLLLHAAAISKCAIDLLFDAKRRLKARGDSLKLFGIEQLI
jgi:hypothetical protein